MVKVFPFKAYLRSDKSPRKKRKKKYRTKHVYFKIKNIDVLECVEVEAKKQGISQSALIVKALQEYMFYSPN